MPNGDPDWGTKEHPMLEAFFGKISDVLEEFADDHNLLIEKYFHQGNSWSFLFRHPKGGIGKIQVQKCKEDQVKIYPIWWIDYYEENRRDSKHPNGSKVSLERDELRKELDKLFRIIISWAKEELEIGSPNPNSIWKKTWNKEEFEKQDEQYPIPKID